MEKVKIPKSILDRITEFRHELHQHPELAHQEEKTAERLGKFLKDVSFEKVEDQIGGTGIIFTIKGKEAGKNLLFRAELDALPIQEENSMDYRSKTEKVSHKCGHDGHMAILCGLALLLQEKQDFKGNVHFLFQPAEETGEGAEKMIDDKKMQAYEVDYAFALHNLPGFSKGQIILKKGVFAAASKGLIVQLKGRPTHASHPKDGINPIPAGSKIIQLFSEIPNMQTQLEEIVQITPVGINMGQKAFGTSASEGELYATVRTYENVSMQRVSDELEEQIKQIAKLYHLQISISWTEEFKAVENHEKAYDFVEKATNSLKFDQKEVETPFPWSEDFGQFGRQFPICLFGLGSGKNQPQLHQENYDFPDEIMEKGIQIFYQIIKEANR